jgi:hypothetical protein
MFSLLSCKGDKLRCGARPMGISQRRLSSWSWPHPRWGLECYFRIDVTFEMRTVLSRIRLLFDNSKLSDSIFILYQMEMEGKRAGYQSDRESVCERQHIA